MKLYTLKEKEETGEYHIFRGTPVEASCRSESMSICGKMKASESKRNIFTCEKEDDARNKSAEIGRKVCGVCVSHLYTTY